jgi:hypothetical protein
MPPLLAMEGQHLGLVGIEQNDRRPVVRTVPAFSGPGIDGFVRTAPQVDHGLPFAFDHVRVGFMEVGQDGNMGVLEIWMLVPESLPVVTGSPSSSGVLVFEVEDIALSADHNSESASCLSDAWATQGISQSRHDAL